jgi:peptidylprolyl isomerase
MHTKYYSVQILSLFLVLLSTPISADDDLLTTQYVIENSSDSDWRIPAAENLLYMQFEGAQIIFELAPDFAPEHIANIRKLVAARYFEGLSIIRSQDNYVVQWGDPSAGKKGAKAFGTAKAELAPEFYRKHAGLNITSLDSQDAYADEVGFANGFPVASDSQRVWLTHCYGTLGVGRDYAFNSGNGAEMYVVTGHAPRHLDRNVTLIGRVLQGIDNLSTLPRGTGALGFYETEKEHVKITSVYFGDEIPESKRAKIEVMRTDTKTFELFVQARTFRVHKWFADPAGRIELCNVTAPVRSKK